MLPLWCNCKIEHYVVDCFLSLPLLTYLLSVQHRIIICYLFQWRHTSNIFLTSGRSDHNRHLLDQSSHSSCERTRALHTVGCASLQNWSDQTWHKAWSEFGIWFHAHRGRSTPHKWVQMLPRLLCLQVWGNCHLKPQVRAVPSWSCCPSARPEQTREFPHGIQLCEQGAGDLICWEAQGKCITRAFSGVPHKRHGHPLPSPFPGTCAALWGGKGVPAAEASARPCLPLHSLSLQIDIFYSNFLQSSWSAAKQIAMTQFITTTEWELTLTS